MAKGENGSALSQFLLPRWPSWPCFSPHYAALTRGSLYRPAESVGPAEQLIPRAGRLPLCGNELALLRRLLQSRVGQFIASRVGNYVARLRDMPTRHIGQDMIYVKAVASSSVHDLACQDLRGLTMQDLDYLTGAQAVWLRILESCGYEGLPDGITIPDDELDALVEKGLVRRLRDGAIEITLGGIRAQH